MKDKFVKLSAIERMAAPMKEFHKGGAQESEREYESEEDMCECPKCGHEYTHGSEDDKEDKEED